MNTRTNVFTKVVNSPIADDINLVDKLASEGWVLSSIVFDNQKEQYIYWFQSKRKIYEKAKGFK